MGKVNVKIKCYCRFLCYNEEGSLVSFLNIKLPFKLKVMLWKYNWTELILQHVGNPQNAKLTEHLLNCSLTEQIK